MDNTHERINWKKKPLLVAAGIVLALLIGFCIYCAVAEIERPMEPVNLENTREAVILPVRKRTNEVMVFVPDIPKRNR